MATSTVPPVHSSRRTSRCGTSAPMRWPSLSGPNAIASVSTRVPSGPVKVVSSTRVRSTYRRVLVQGPVGWTCQWPACSPSSRPNTDGLSKRGNDSQSTEPPRVTSALECRSDRRAWSAMGVLDMAAAPIVAVAGAGQEPASRASRLRPERKKASASSGVATSSLVTNAPKGAFQKASRTGGPSYGPT